MMAHSRRRVLLISSLGHAYSHACMLSIPPLLLLLKDEFSLSFTLISLAVTASGILFGLGALPFGPLSDRIGAIRVNIIGVVLAIVAGLGLYFATSSYVFIAFLLLLGIASSTYHPSAFNMISCMYTSEMGRAFGINGMIGNVGQIGAPITTGFIAYTWGWRPVFLLLVAIGIVVLSLLVSVRTFSFESPPSEEGGRSFMLARPFLLLLVITMLGGLAYRGIVTMLPSYTSIIFQQNTFEGGTLVTLLLLMGGVSQIIAGELRDRLGASRPFLVTTLLALASVAIMMTEAYSALLVGLIFFGFSYFAINLYTNTIIGEVAPTGQKGTVYGIMFFARFGLAYVAPFIVGAVTDLYSIRYLFHIAAAFLVVLVIFTAYFYATRSRSVTP
ncbi:MAG TPA: MFS transporter [Methanomicrobia archaeon]|nr:MFS transporter [Methanomicrobia archaeon]